MTHQEHRAARLGARIIELEGQLKATTKKAEAVVIADRQIAKTGETYNGLDGLCAAVDALAEHLETGPRDDDAGVPEHLLEPGESVESTSDERTVNNTLRHQYRVLSDEEKAQMQGIKDVGALLHNRITELAGGHVGRRRDGTPLVAEPELLTAQRKTEEAVMWACKFITS
jgi:hypothetical protein